VASLPWPIDDDPDAPGIERLERLVDCLAEGSMLPASRREQFAETCRWFGVL
jgi:hypothetical protein